MATKTFRFRIYPNVVQKDLLVRSFGCKRFVWNQVLNRVQEEYKAYQTNPTLEKPKLSANSLVVRLPELKKEHGFLYDVSAVALQQSLRDLGVAFQSFFKGKGRVGFPKFKKKQSRQSIRLVGDAFSLDLESGEFRMAKVMHSPIKTKWSYKNEKWGGVLPTQPSSCSIIRESDGKYYACFICEVEPRLTNGQIHLGLDLGIKTFAVDSEGKEYANPKYQEQYARRLARAQRSLSRKKKGSVNYRKQKLKVAKTYAKTKQCRMDFQHKLSRSLVDQCMTIAIEDLNIEGMVRNRRLAKHIADCGWRQFLSMLLYKADESQHCKVVIAERFFPSSQTCSVCNHRLEKEHKLKLHQRWWVCPSCGTQHDRDHNAAINLRNMALDMLPPASHLRNTLTAVFIQEHHITA
jgi:putative transposase